MSLWRDRGRQLGLREQLVARAREHDQGYSYSLILGREYLTAIGLSLPVDTLPPSIIYHAPSLVERVRHGVEIRPVGPIERREMRAYSSAAKEKRFRMDVYCTLHLRADRG
jgi:hypothetical protein